MLLDSFPSEKYKQQCSAKLQWVALRQPAARHVFVWDSREETTRALHSLDPQVRCCYVPLHARRAPPTAGFCRVARGTFTACPDLLC